MNFGFLIILAVVVIVAAVVLPLICHTRQWRLVRLGLKQIAGNKPTAAANLPYRQTAEILRQAQDDNRGGGRPGGPSLPTAICKQPCVSVAHEIHSPFATQGFGRTLRTTPLLTPP
jgi:hypothetical protein